MTHESAMWDKPDQSPPVTDPARVTVPPFLPDTPGLRRALARHYDNLAAAARQLGDLLAQLEAKIELANTMIYVWSDHGEGLPRAKATRVGFTDSPEQTATFTII
ncbi:MAG: hypothetical protein PCFJNLEI_03494 [Verrucomicrobiae bacterium]|nr:hypothetical protein [Verrucomicrobiae bacterium]